MDGRLSTASVTPEEARARTSAAWRKESGGSAADSEAKGEVQKLDTEFNTLLQKIDQTAAQLRVRHWPHTVRQESGLYLLRLGDVLKGDVMRCREFPSEGTLPVGGVS